MAVDVIAKSEGKSFDRSSGSTSYCSFELHGGEKVFLGKPETFMNLSGKGVKYFRKKFSFPLESLAVVHDDLDIPLGKIKVKVGGGAGGHKGIASIIGGLGSPDFARVKIGIGRPPGDVDPSEYVLMPPSPGMEENFFVGVRHAADAIMFLLNEGLEKAANYYNSEGPYQG